MNKAPLIILLLLLSITGTSQELNITLKGKVIKIADGDTFTLLDENNIQYKVRLDGIDCPEKKQDFGSKATDFLKSHIAGKNVIVVYNKMDRYKRILGVVYVDGVSINEELLKNGLAWHYKEYNSNQRYASLEREARRKKLNIWSLKNPVYPADFRKEKRKK